MRLRFLFRTIFSFFLELTVFLLASKFTVSGVKAGSLYIGGDKGIIVSYVYNDANGDGKFETIEAPVLDGWLITLYDSNLIEVKHMLSGDDNAGASNVESGHFVFKDLNPGMYYVCETLKPGWIQTEPSSGGQVFGGTFCRGVSLSAGTMVFGIPFGNVRLGSITGFSYFDKDRDNVWDGQSSGEPKMNNWKIFIDEDNDGSFDEGEVYFLTHELADSLKGQYLFTDLLPGTYQICEVIREGWQSTLPGGTNCQSVVIQSIVTGDYKTDKNFGNRPIL